MDDLLKTIETPWAATVLKCFNKLTILQFVEGENVYFPFPTLCLIKREVRFHTQSSSRDSTDPAVLFIYIVTK